MKKISEHLGEIIIALAGVALLITACVVFRAPIGDFFNGIIGKETNVANTVLAGVEDPNLSDLSSGGGSNVDLSGKTEVDLLDGDNLTYNKTSPTTLSFRSPAEYSTFQDVLVDGKVVSKSNYTVTEGSTVVTFTEDYSASLALGEHTVVIVSETAYATGSVEVVESANTGHSGTIPEGGTYKAADGTVYNAGEAFPVLTAGDIYAYGDYEYCYGYQWCDACCMWSYECGDEYMTSGWSVYCMAFNSTAPGAIIESINGAVIADMRQTFYDCNSLEIAPVIPSSVTNMSGTFYNCVFLTSAPEIPSSVTDMSCTFYNCVRLTGTITINATNLTKYNKCFYDTKQPITITTTDGACTVLNEIAATANNGNVTVG